MLKLTPNALWSSSKFILAETVPGQLYVRYEDSGFVTVPEGKDWAIFLRHTFQFDVRVVFSASKN